MRDKRIVIENDAPILCATNTFLSNRIAVGTASGNFQTFEINESEFSATPVAQLKLNHAIHSCEKFGQSFLLGLSDGSLMIFDPDQETHKITFTADSAINAIDIIDENSVVIATNDGLVHVLDFRKQNPGKSLYKDFCDSISDIKYDNNRLFAAAGDLMAVIDLKSGPDAIDFSEQLEYELYSLSLTADSKYVLSATSDGIKAFSKDCCTVPALSIGALGYETYAIQSFGSSNNFIAGGELGEIVIGRVQPPSIIGTCDRSPSELEMSVDKLLLFANCSLVLSIDYCSSAAIVSDIAEAIKSSNAGDVIDAPTIEQQFFVDLI